MHRLKRQGTTRAHAIETNIGRFIDSRHTISHRLCRIAMDDSLTIHVRNHVEAIAPASREVENWLQHRDLSPSASYLANLAIEELVTNCIKHAYDDPDEHTIEFVFSIADRILTILAVDDGREFDPSQSPSPDISQPAENRPIGGLGIHLLREMADSMRYERRDGRNHLTLTKRLP